MLFPTIIRMFSTLTKGKVRVQHGINFDLYKRSAGAHHNVSGVKGVYRPMPVHSARYLTA